MRAAFVVLIVAGGLASAAPARWDTLPLPPAMPTATKASSITVDGAQIYYAIYGTSSAEAPVILLHGGLGNSDHWANQVPALVDAKHEVITIDSRGQGRSTRAGAKISYDVMATDVIAVMDALAVKQAAIVGWSDGGEVALKLAIAHPDRVAKLFVFGSNYNSEGSKSRRNAPTATFSAYAQKCRTDYQKLSKTPKQFDELVDWLLPIWRNPMGITKDQLRAIQAPAMIADGDHDEVILLAQVEEMAKLIPHGQLKVFDDASHFALWQDPQAFNKALVEFLAP
ncbi:MAG TPA: alpha/beta hydrolase [Kofleriaceae bacterium]|nr:alpha/beta hydrolase [Kofleriaceae bacterium]